MADLYVGQNDQLPALQHQMLDPLGAIQALTGTTVNFVLHRVNRFTGVRTELINSPATIVDAVNGIARYTLTAGDALLLTPDDYQVRWRVLFGSQPLSFPNDRWLTLHIS